MAEPCDILQDRFPPRKGKGGSTETGISTIGRVMRLHPKFSLRALLTAVLLAGVGCWYFVNGSAFHEKTRVIYLKSDVAPSEHGTFPTWKLTAYVSRHYFLSHQDRVHLVILEHGDFFIGVPDYRTQYGDRHFWRSHMNGKIGHRYAKSSEWLVEYYYAGKNWQRVWIPRDKDHPINTPIIDVTGMGGTSLENPKNYTSMSITCSELDRFATDATVSSWSIASLEKWLKEHRK